MSGLITSLLILIVITTLSSSSLDPRFGVDPASYSLYSRSTISCQTEGPIPISRVNDDYCDCPDRGEDEPGTSACSNGTFFCKNMGSKPARIESWRVNDGICDCCDGSDEYLGLIQCPSTCEQEGKIIRARLENLALTVNKGLDKQQELSRSGDSLKHHQSDRLQSLQAQIDMKRKEVDDLRRSVELAERAANAEKKTQTDDTETGTKTEPVPQEDNSVNTDSSKDQEQADTQSAFPYPEQYAYTGNAPDSDGSSSQHDPDTETKSDDQEHELENELTGEQESDRSSEQESVESPAAKAAREARQTLTNVENELSKMEKESDDLSKMLRIDYGPNSAYRILQSECFSITHEKYTYKLCPFHEITQAESYSTSLGSFQGWSNNYTEWLFDHGQRCWNGPERSVKVKLACGQNNRVVSVHEPSTCVYEMLFETPAACSLDDAAKLKSEIDALSRDEHVHDEL